MAGERNQGIPLCALWLNETKDGKRYYRGKLGDAQILGWIQEEKTNERQPDLRLMLYPAQPKEETRAKRKPASDDDVPY